MKKWLLKLSLVAMTLLLLPIQAVQACCGFIIGRQLTKDGTTLFGRTEDYPYYPNGGKHNKNFVVVDAKNYKDCLLYTSLRWQPFLVYWPCWD